MSGNWIEHLKKGGLHKSLHMASDKIIPQSKIMKAAHADNPKVAKQARAAEALEHMRKKCDGGKV